MQKYLYSFRMYLLTSFQYRFDTVLELIMSNISMFITIIFWILIYRSNGMIAPFFAQYLTWDLSVHSAILLVIYLATATVISHLMWSLLGMVAFWLEQAQAVMWSFAVILNFLSGMFMPLDFFPDWSVRVLELMPFAAFSYIPAKLYMNQISPAESVNLLIVYIMWIFVLMTLNLAVWRAGVKKYSAIGG